MTTSKIIKTILALTLVVFIPLLLMIWHRIHEPSGFVTKELIMYPLFFGGAAIILIYLLKKYFLNEDLLDFNSGIGNWKSDIGWGLVLVLIYFVLFFLERHTLTNVLEFIPNMEMLNLILDIREKPLLIILFFGPVLWIGVSLFEELVRAFILTSLWKFNDLQIWTALVIIFSALVFGLAHWSQGSYGMVTIGIKSLVSGYFFFKIRRLMPLIYAHALYDGLQVGTLLMTYPG
jgi:membrane protease YdiL (CAAX protease family)